MRNCTHKHLSSNSQAEKGRITQQGEPRWKNEKIRIRIKKIQNSTSNDS